MAVRYQAYPEYKDSGVEWVDRVPSDWTLKQAKYQFILQRGHDLSSDKMIEGKYPVFGSNGSIGQHNDFTTTSPSITVGRSGSVGEVNYIEQDFWAHNTSLYVKDFKGTPPKFLYYLLKAIDPKRLSAGSAVGTLDRNNIHKQIVAVPSLSEMSKIADFLDHKTAKIDTLIEKQQQLITLLKEKRQAVISHAVTKGLNPEAPMRDSGVEWLGEVPEHWILKNYRYATQIFRGKFGHRPRNDPAFYDGEYPFIQTGDVAQADKKIKKYKQTLNEKGKNVSEKFPAGTLVMAIAANIGDTAILDFEAYAPDSIVGFKPNNDIELEFLRYSLMAALPALEQISTQSTQANLNIDRIGTVKASFPPIKEQQKIVAQLDKLHEQYSAIEAKALDAIKLMQERRAALISAAVTGKIDVRNWQAPTPTANKPTIRQ